MCSQVERKYLQTEIDYTERKLCIIRYMSKRERGRIRTVEDFVGEFRISEANSWFQQLSQLSQINSLNREHSCYDMIDATVLRN